MMHGQQKTLYEAYLSGDVINVVNQILEPV